MLLRVNILWDTIWPLLFAITKRPSNKVLLICGLCRCGKCCFCLLLLLLPFIFFNAHELKMLPQCPHPQIKCCFILVFDICNIWKIIPFTCEVDSYLLSFMKLYNTMRRKHTSINLKTTAFNLILTANIKNAALSLSTLCLTPSVLFTHCIQLHDGLCYVCCLNNHTHTHTQFKEHNKHKHDTFGCKLS